MIRKGAKTAGWVPHMQSNAANAMFPKWLTDNINQHMKSNVNGSHAIASVYQRIKEIVDARKHVVSDYSVRLQRILTPAGAISMGGDVEMGSGDLQSAAQAKDWREELKWPVGDEIRADVHKWKRVETNKKKIPETHRDRLRFKITVL